MGKQKEPWWNYVKKIIRKYPTLKKKVPGTLTKSEERMFVAVDGAIRTTKCTHPHDYEIRLKVVDLVYWKKSHTIDGAAIIVTCHPNTAGKYQADFIRLVAEELDLP